jgi:hypothetical protein
LLEPHEVERVVIAFRRGDDREVQRVWTCSHSRCGNSVGWRPEADCADSDRY